MKPNGFRIGVCVNMLGLAVLYPNYKTLLNEERMNMQNQGYLSTWELFLGEIERNIHPSKGKIEESLRFLLSGGFCSEKKFKAIVAVRSMAAYEQAINEYLHPPQNFKQANIKAEYIHFGSLFESILGILLSDLVSRKVFTPIEYKMATKRDVHAINVHDGEPSGTTKKDKITFFTFKIMIDCLSVWNKEKNNTDQEFVEYLRISDQLRNERNSVHINKMVDMDLIHEEYRLVEIREKWVHFIAFVKNTLELTSGGTNGQ